MDAYFNTLADKAFKNKSDYQGKKPLDGEFQKIPESELKPTAKIKKIRLYR